MRKDLLPNLPVSPTVGLGATGIQAGLRIKRKPDAVPADSAVGKGLNNISIGMGAEVQVETALDRMRRKIKLTDTKKQDMLMGHAKLNPESYQPMVNRGKSKGAALLQKVASHRRA
jgi:hypothetical protein